MSSEEEVRYRQRVAQGFLNEARQDADLRRWRSAVDNAQLATENAAKAVLALLGPVGRTHHPAVPLRQAVTEGLFPVHSQDWVRRLIELAELMGPDIHKQTDYGDEVGGRTPWELFAETDARQALVAAEEAIGLVEVIIHGLGR